MNIKLLSDLVLIKRHEAERQVGAILLAESAVEELQEGTIVAIGPGKQRKGAHGIWVQPMTVKVGDQVLFSKHGHMPVKLDDEQYVTLHEDGIVGVRTAQPTDQELVAQENAHVAAIGRLTSTIGGRKVGADEVTA